METERFLQGLSVLCAFLMFVSPFSIIGVFVSVGAIAVVKWLQREQTSRLQELEDMIKDLQTKISGVQMSIGGRR